MMTVLTGSFYKPTRGGHAPGDVRDAFAAAVRAYDRWKAGAKPTVELQEQQVWIREVCGLLWNCTDTMPNLLRSYFRNWGEPDPRSYAAAARLLRTLVAGAIAR